MERPGSLGALGDPLAEVSGPVGSTCSCSSSLSPPKGWHCSLQAALMENAKHGLQVPHQLTGNQPLTGTGCLVCAKSCARSW